jgi:broad-specificity NMP kinase
MSSSTGVRDAPRRGRLPVVELIGTPGSGKTTLAPVVIDLLREQGWTASTIVDAARDHAERTPAGALIVRRTSGRVRGLLLWWLFYALASVHAAMFVLEVPRLSRTVVSTQLRRPIRMARKAHICFWFFQLAGRERFLSATAREREVLVVDDGFLHRAVHCYASHREVPSPQAVAAYVNLLPGPALVVRVRCDEEICEQRVRRRGVWRHSRRLTVGELGRYLQRSDVVVDLATQQARARGWRVAEVVNDSTPVAAIRAALVPDVVSVFPRSSPPADRPVGAGA